MGSELFGIGALLFIAQPFEFRCDGWTGFMPDLRPDGSSLDHLKQAFHGILPVALLCSEPSGFYDYFAQRIYALARDTQQPFADFGL